MYERNLIPHQSVAGIVATYQQTQKEITKAFGLLDQAKKRLKLTDIEDTVLEINARDYDLHRKCQDSITMLRQNTWCFIIGKCNIKGCLSSSRSLECETEYFAFRWYKKRQPAHSLQPPGPGPAFEQAGRW